MHNTLDWVQKHLFRSFSIFSDPSLHLRPQKPRTIFRPDQLEILEKAFKANSYPSAKKKRILAANTSLTDERVRIWFQNRRAKEKRLKEEKLAMSINVPKKGGERMLFGNNVSNFYEFNFVCLHFSLEGNRHIYQEEAINRPKKAHTTIVSLDKQ